MPRERTGFISTRKNKKNDELEYFARIQYTDASGKRRELMRRAKDEAHANKLIKKLVKKMDDTGERGVEGDRIQFRQLAAEYKKRKLIPAEYHGHEGDERKVAGLRSWRTPQGFLTTLIEHFGAQRIRNITHDDIEQFKLLRLKTPTARGAHRTIASVNRELELMRAVMRFAVRQGWLVRSPFESGAPLISKSDEVRRERVLSHEEEARLLAACTGRRGHLRALLVAALDTAMRRGELLKLRWSDVDMTTQEIKIKAMNTKTARARVVAMTPRLYAELESLQATAPPDPNVLVFGITDTVKKSFAAACIAAGIGGFRFHDCRHTAITRMIEAGIPPMEVMKVSGHTQMNTFARYINPNSHAVRRAAEVLAAFNAEAGAQKALEMVN